MNSCNNCVFLENNDCSLGLVDIIKTKYEYEYIDGVLNFDGECYSFRDEEWAKNRACDLKEVIKQETQIKPAIFCAINNEQDLINLRENWADEISGASYLNLINYSQLSVEQIRSYFPEAYVTQNLIELVHEYTILNNLRTIKKPAIYMMIITDTSKKPAADLYNKTWHKIQRKLEPLVAVVGEGYHMVFSVMWYLLVMNGESVADFLSKQLQEEKHVVHDRTL